MTTQTFGLAFSREVAKACATLSMPGFPVYPEWILATCAIESGFNPIARKPGASYRGLFQMGPTDLGPANGRTPANALEYLSGGRLMRLYSCPSPERQMRDALNLWMSFRGTGIRTKEALYCANLAPARLLQRDYGPDTILYSANPEDAHLNNQGNGWQKTYWPAAYRENAAPFGLDPKNPRGQLRMRDLSFGLDKYVRLNQDRYNAELHNVYIVNAGG